MICLVLAGSLVFAYGNWRCVDYSQDVKFTVWLQPVLEISPRVQPTSLVAPCYYGIHYLNTHGVPLIIAIADKLAGMGFVV